MGDSQSTQARCAEMVAAFGREHNLTPEQEAAYVQALIAYLPGHYTDAQLQRTISCYHLDHQEVQALHNPQNPDHEEAWGNWRDQVFRILRSANLNWLAAGPIDLDDLTQIAVEELSKSIGSYRFNSRFSTWAYTVAVRAAQRSLRALQAAKRTGRVVSLDDPTVSAYPVGGIGNPETWGMARELNELISAILVEQGDPRLLEIFQLRAHSDHRLVDIGQRLGLSPSRVSILLDQIRSLLRDHPALREWRGMTERGAEPPDDADS